MNTSAAPDYLELSDYLGVLRRRWVTIVLLTCIGIVLGGAYVELVPPVYTASTLVQVNALSSNANAVGGRTAGLVNMDNEAQVVKSGTVAARVKTRLHSHMTLIDIDKQISVLVPPNSTFLQISYAGPTAADAARWADAVAKAYLYQRRVSTQALIGTGLQALRDQVAKLRGTVERLKLKVAADRHGTASQGSIVHDELLLNDAQAALTSDVTHIDQALPLYANLSAPHSTLVGQIVTPASPPASPTSPRKLLILPGGLAAGLIIGLAWAFLRDRRNRRVHSAQEVERLTREPTLLQVSGQVTGVESARSKTGQAFAELARHISASLGGGNHVLAVAATAPGPGGSVVTANLAAALARTTDETIIVCGDAEQTRLPEMLGVARDRGLAEVLSGTATADDVAIKVIGLPRLRLVTPGLESAGLVSGIRHAKSARFLTDLLGIARYVVIEVHAVGDDAATFSLAEFGETSVVAAELERSRPGDILDCLERLDRLKTPVLGTTIMPAGPASRKRQPAYTPPASSGPPGPAPGPSVNPIRAYESQPEAEQTAAAGSGEWVAESPKPSFNLLDFSGSSAPHKPADWRPPRVAASERERADPSSGS
jgi:capsular polysaccharide biosynthesis protein